MGICFSAASASAPVSHASQAPTLLGKHESPAKHHFRSKFSSDLAPREDAVRNWLLNRATNADGLLQTYDAYPGQPGLENRHDIYDNSLAAIFFDMHGECDKAHSILSAFVKLLDDVKATNGRLAAAYGPDGSVLDGRQDAGNNAWAIVSLAFHGKLQPSSGFLQNATDLLQRLKQEQNFAKSTPFDPQHPHSVEQTAGSGNCSTENTTDLVTAARICKDEDLGNVCQKFVNAVFDPTFQGTPAGAYLAGTTPDGNLYYDVLPCDCQTWTLLADADTKADRGRLAMDAMLKVFYMKNAPGSPPGTSYAGVRFSNHPDSTNIQMENTASCAMAIAKYIHDASDPGTELSAALKAMASTLTDLVDKNNGGVPAAIVRTGSGYGYDYFPTLHVASTVWTGMFFGCTREEAAYDAHFNPYHVDKEV